MTSNQLTAALAERVMGWRVAPGRFLTGNRRWITNSRFQPLHRVQDALRLLHTAAAEFTLARTADGVFSATVRIGERAGTASGEFDARTITLAVVRALGIDAEDIR
jgi:hypothetical protein